MPADAVQPWQYATTYLPYDIGRGAADTQARFVLIIRNNQLRMFFTPMDAPQLKVAAFAFDLSAYDYQGGQIGVYMYIRQRRKSNCGACN